MLDYDEGVLRGRLSRLGRSEKTAFAAACAQRLLPLFVRYAEVTRRGDTRALAGVLEDTWRAAAGDEVDLEHAPGIAEEMVPPDDAEWVHELGYGQSAAASVAYAARTWLTDDPQEATWAARQVYEAADYAAQRSLPALDLNAPDAERRLLESPVVQSALSGLSSDLAAAEAMSGGWEALRERARREGEVWARSLPS